VEIEQEFLVRTGRGAMLRRNDGRRKNFAMRFRAYARLGAAILLGKVLARARDREALFIQQALDFEDGFDILAAIKTVAARAFYGLKRGEFGLPVAQDEGFRRGEAAHFSDAEKALFRDFARSLGRTCHVLFVS